MAIPVIRSARPAGIAAAQQSQIAERAFSDLRRFQQRQRTLTQRLEDWASCADYMIGDGLPHTLDERFASLADFQNYFLLPSTHLTLGATSGAYRALSTAQIPLNSANGLSR